MTDTHIHMQPIIIPLQLCAQWDNHKHTHRHTHTHHHHHHTTTKKQEQHKHGNMLPLHKFKSVCGLQTLPDIDRTYQNILSPPPHPTIPFPLTSPPPPPPVPSTNQFGFAQIVGLTTVWRRGRRRISRRYWSLTVTRIKIVAHIKDPMSTFQ